ncbi:MULTISPECIES: DUF397 domain-containing protein [Glycomyces]|uniref:DUF397 domain-containing protein n=2 Tax=Glycomyces TaxID=58113 RepID=A0A9X3SYE9_9ACTN|nr:DUF397 domain-containing protein [Glycomyces lechevalierae]MDA1386206.1 DUF397 domain-containing protein [Glycomyces lechevalierae]MDR7338320.1 hypothetical protein [Glycomyces lechevalierae]
MTKREHPLKGEFDTATARWERTTHEDGTPAALEIGYADNGLVALRMAEDPDGDILIYTPSEWEAFVEGVRDGEFDIETWDDEPIVEIIEDEEDETEQGETDAEVEARIMDEVGDKPAGQSASN